MTDRQWRTDARHDSFDMFGTSYQSGSLATMERPGFGDDFDYAGYAAYSSDPRIT